MSEIGQQIADNARRQAEKAEQQQQAAEQRQQQQQQAATFIGPELMSVTVY